MDTYVAGSTVYHFFNTHKADGTPITLAGSPGIDIYKDNGTTQDADDSGLTLTVDFDSVTGLHLITVDTSQDGTFYTTGHAFNVVLDAGTVDSVSVVGTTVYQFKIGEVPVDVVKVSGDATAADNLEDLFEETTAVGNLIDFVDGTGYAGGTIKLASDATLNATQGSYAPAKAGDAMTLTAAYDAAKTAAAAGAKMDIIDAPSATGVGVIVSAIWDKLLTGITTTGSIGKLIKDYLDAAISTRSTYAGGAVASVTAGVTVTTNNDKTGYTATVSDKTGFSLSSDGITAIWHQLLSAITTADSIGKLLKDNINATIGSRSSHSAADVWAVATRTLTDKAGFSLSVTPPTAQNIWEYATRALTDKSGFSGTVTDKTGFSLSQTFPTNFSSLAITEAGAVTATSLSAQEVRDAMKLAPTAGAPATGSVDKLLDDLPTLTEIEASTVLAMVDDLPSEPPSAATIADAVLDEAKGTHAGHLADIPTNPYTGTPPTVGQIDTQLSGTHGAGAWGSAGTGSSTYTDTITDDDGDPLEDVQVELYSDSDYTTLVAVEETDVNGAFTFSLNPGLYYCRAIKSGYSFTDWTKTVT